MASSDQRARGLHKAAAHAGSSGARWDPAVAQGGFSGDSLHGAASARRSGDGRQPEGWDPTEREASPCRCLMGRKRGTDEISHESHDIDVLDASASQHVCDNDLKHVQKPETLFVDSEFHDKLDHYYGCQLPMELKASICKLIKKYCLNGGVNLNIDVNSITSLPKEMKITFSKLMQHASSIDSRIHELVLELMKLFSSFVGHDVPEIYDDDKHPLTSNIELSESDAAIIMEKSTNKDPIYHTMYVFNQASEVESVEDDIEFKRTPMCDTFTERTGTKLDVISDDNEYLYHTDSVSTPSIPVWSPFFHTKDPALLLTSDFNREPKKSMLLIHQTQLDSLLRNFFSHHRCKWILRFLLKFK